MDGLPRRRLPGRGPRTGRRGLRAEGRTAPARGLGVRVADGEAAARQAVHEIDFGALQVANADRIDEEPHAVRLDGLVGFGLGLAFLDHQPVLEARAAAALDEYPEAGVELVLLREELGDLLGSRWSHADHVNSI